MNRKYNHNGLPKRRVIVAAEQEVKRRVVKAEKRGIKNGRLIGKRTVEWDFKEMSFFARLKLVFTKYKNV